MYKIITLDISFDNPYDDHTVVLSDESFETIEAAKEHIINNLIHQDIIDFIDGDEDVAESAEFERSDYKDQIVHEVFNYGDLVYKIEYHIVEVK